MWMRLLTRTEEQHAILQRPETSGLSFASPSLAADPTFAASSSFTASASITVNSFLNTNSPTFGPGTPSSQSDFVLRSDVEQSSISAPGSRSSSLRKRQHPSSNQFGTETESRKGSRSNSRQSSVSSKSVGSDASTGVRSIEFPRGIKESAKRYYNYRCWLCEHPHRKLNVAHVIPRADIEFEAQVSRGILPLSELHDINNAIPLCVTCHDPFDAKRPGFIILPIDLPWFLDFERADFNDRQRLLREGKSRRRIVPTGQMYRAHLEREGKLAAFPSAGGKGVNRAVINECQDQGGLYEVYVRTDHLTNHWDDREILGLFFSGKIWHGSPTALILHAARVLGYPNRGKEWIDEEKLRLIFELILLWGREPTSSHQTGEDLDNSAGENTPASPPPNPEGKDEPPCGPPSFHDGFQGGSAASETAVGTEGGDSECGGCGYRLVAPISTKMDNRWQWGPLITANDIVRFFSGVGM
ncbi:hypothetical protein ABW19_dt0206002 [Dactylella cylindrospora]|nr:hypothetical protein ABW19_dt0206002 [Dactylella cylindrospora]